MNFWRHLRTAGAVLVLAGIYVTKTPNVGLVALGLATTAIGSIIGLDMLERRVENLETERTNEKN